MIVEVKAMSSQPYNAGLSPTPPPRLEARDSLTSRSTNVCGYYTLEKDKLIRTHQCPPNEACRISDGFIGCNNIAYSVCANAREIQGCQSGKTVGAGTLCCRETSGWVPACQTYVRDDAELGIKKMYGCRDVALAWDKTVTLHWETTLLVQIDSLTLPAASTTTSGSSLAAGSSVEARTSEAPAKASPTTTSATTLPSASESTDMSNNNSSSSQAGVIVGGVIGGIAIVSAFSCFVLWLLVRRRRVFEEKEETTGRRIETPMAELQGDEPDASQNREQGEYRPTALVPPAPPESPVIRVSAPRISTASVCKAPSGNQLGSPTTPAELDS
ncbi:hypothetical protein CKAH01_02038 [Colletotrichum kahawae]|uniref:Uncharacterized protein n=1 Tax=Colletotrichum kahawae TaxID=34407 RepID=A0AAE0D181_COLKA|nr:hypothetical protein CKAH01_02038 [Colletotrichum kahawae]